jgi:hypothetical protein
VRMLFKDLRQCSTDYRQDIPKQTDYPEYHGTSNRNANISFKFA